MTFIAQGISCAELSGVEKMDDLSHRNAAQRRGLLGGSQIDRKNAEPT